MCFTKGRLRVFNKSKCVFVIMGLILNVFFCFRHHKIRENTIASFLSAASHVSKDKATQYMMIFNKIKDYNTCLWITGSRLRRVWRSSLKGFSSSRLPRSHLLYFNKEGNLVGWCCYVTAIVMSFYSLWPTHILSSTTVVLSQMVWMFYMNR